MPPRGLMSENTLKDSAAMEPKIKPTAPTVSADIRRDNFVSSHNQDTGASIIAIDDVKAAKNSKIKIIANELSLTKLFEECSYFIAVRSSLIYTALQAGKNILIYKKYNYDWDKILLKSSITFLTAHEINYAINNTMNNKNTSLEENVYFKKLDSSKFLKFLNR